MTTVDKLEHILGKGRIKTNQELFPYLTLRTETVAGFFFEAETREDLINAQKGSRETNIPLLILGGGSNVALLNKKINGLVVRNLYQKMKTIKTDQNSIDIQYSSGYPVSRLVKETVVEGYGGFEYHLGLPGTVGGALYMNSKWTRPVCYFGDRLIQADLLDQQGKIRTVNKTYFQFGYDFSILQKTKEMVLDAIFRLKKMSPAVLKKRSQQALEYRKKTQPFGVFSSGCFFRNIPEKQRQKLDLPTTSAGYLIDKTGLKGYSVGNFYISDKHANFILNTGEGKPADLRKLLDTIKERVKEKFGIRLEEEVIII